MGSPNDGARAALDVILLDALQRPPCLVAFSGGRDSSALLAVAVDAARSHGLAPPIAATMRYAGHGATDEDDWQALVLDHLGVNDRLLLDASGDHDVAGPLARDLLARHGPLWPPQIGSLVPLLNAAAGGTLVTGSGGDEAFGAWRWRPHPGLAHRARRTIYRSAPLVARAALERLRPPRQDRSRPWLTRHGARVVTRELARDAAREPTDYGEYLRALRHHRMVALAATSTAIVASAIGVTVVEPFRHPSFLAALGREAGPASFGTRDDAMRRLFADVLPDGILVRRTKATFTTAFMAEHTRDAARRWDGEGINRGLVDPDLLRASWLLAVPDFRSALLLQHVVVGGHA